MSGAADYRVSPHFYLSELTVSQTAARRGLDNTPPPDVVEALKRTALLLEGVRVLLGAPVTVTSGYRSPAVNAAVGGAATSQHLSGRAADFIAPGFGGPRAIVQRLLGAGLPYDQLIQEFAGDDSVGGWTHISWALKPRQQTLIVDARGARPWA